MIFSTHRTLEEFATALILTVTLTLVLAVPELQIMVALTRALNSLLFIDLCPKLNSVIYSYHGEAPFSTKEASAMRGIKSQINSSFFSLC